MIGYHFSQSENLDQGIDLLPNPAYESSWGYNGFYKALERYRPADKRAHRDSVFIAATLEDSDLACGGGETIALVVPQGFIQWHDVNWSSDISCLISDGHFIDSDAVAQAACKYWSGEPHPDESVWEGTCDRARVVMAFDNEADDQSEDSRVAWAARMLIDLSQSYPRGAFRMTSCPFPEVYCASTPVRSFLMGWAIRSCSLMRDSSHSIFFSLI